MIKGMTGYARALKGRYSAELQSVNKRHLDLRLRLPSSLRPLEMNIRRQIASLVSRGQVSLTITETLETLNLSYLKHLGKIAHEMADQLELDRRTCFELALQETGGKLFAAQDVSKEEVMALVQEVLDSLIAMKTEEGLALQNDLTKRIGLISTLTDQIESLASDATEQMREKLKARLIELTDDERVLREVAILAEKMDITEEIVRLRYHLKLFQEASGGGKTLEFITQEIMREANTIASKASDARVAELVIAIKSELEKIREQVQNIE